MAPLIRVGDQIRVEWKDSHVIRTGDVIAFATETGFRVHRVRRLSPSEGGTSFITQGDLSVRPDGVVSADDYLGIVTTVEKRSCAVRLDTPAGRLCGFISYLTARASLRWHLGKRSARKFVVRTAEVPVLSWLYRSYYRMAVAFVSRVARSFGDEILVRRSFAWGDWLPGASDIDLVWRTQSLNSRSVRRVWTARNLAQIPFPMLGEVFITTAVDLKFWARYAARGMESRFWKPTFLGGAYVHHEIKYRLDLFVRAEHGVEQLSALIWKRFLGLRAGEYERREILKGTVDILSFDWFASLPFGNFHPGQTRLLKTAEFRSRYRKVFEHLDSLGQDSVQGLAGLLQLCLGYVSSSASELVLGVVGAGFAGNRFELPDNLLFLAQEDWTENVLQSLRHGRETWLFQRSVPLFHSKELRTLKALRNPGELFLHDKLLNGLLLRGHVANLLPTLSSQRGYLLTDFQTRWQLQMHVLALRELILPGLSVSQGPLESVRPAAVAKNLVSDDYWLETPFPKLLSIKDELIAHFDGNCVPGGS